MPILIAGVGLQLTLPIVARHADAWHAFFPDSLDEVRPAVDALIGHCEAIGRDPYEIEWSVGLQPDDIDRFLREDADRYLELGLHAVHARLRWARLARGGWPRLPGVA